MTHHSFSRRGFLAAGAGSVLAATMGARPALAATEVALQQSWLPSVQFGGSYIAQSRGYWRDLGLNVALNPGGPNAPVEPPVVAGSALMGISAAAYPAAAVAQGAPFRIIAVSLPDNPLRHRLAARPAG